MMVALYRLGLGAPVPVKDAFNSLNSSGTGGNNRLDDKLRQRLLGRNAKKFMQQQQQQKQQQQAARGKSGQSDDINANKKEVVEEDDEEEGRTSLGKKKRHAQQKTAQVDSEENASGHDGTDELDETNINDSTEPQIPAILTIPSNKRKKTGKVSYLDELLQDRKKKKKKRVE